MINCVSKGRRNELRCRKQLEAEGWKCEQPRRTKWNPIDFYGLYDILAYKDGMWLLIQVKSNYCPKEVREAIRAFKVDGVVVRKQIWVFKDYSKHNPWIEDIP